MAEQVQVGVILNLQGIENIDEAQKELSKFFKDINVGDGLNIGIDKNALKQFQKVVQQFLESINKFQKTVQKEKLEVSIADGDIQKMKRAIEQAFQEALSKIGKSTGKIAAKTAPVNATTKQGLNQVNNSPNDKVATAQLERVADQVKREIATLQRVTREIGVEQDKVIQEISTALGRDVYDGFASFTREASKKITEDLAGVQRSALEQYTKISQAREKAFAEIRGGADRETTKVLMAEIDLLDNSYLPVIKDIISQTEVQRRAIKRRDEAAKESLKIDERRTERLKEVRAFNNQAAQSVKQLVDSFDANAAAQTTQQFARLGDKINNDIKSLQRFKSLNEEFLKSSSGEIENLGRALGLRGKNLEALKKIEDVQGSIAKLANLAREGGGSAPSREQFQTYKQLVASINFYRDAIERAEQDTEEFVANSNKVRTLTGQFRDFTKISKDLAQARSEFGRFTAQLNGTDEEAREAAISLLKLGNDTQTANDKIRRMVASIQQLAATEGHLSSENEDLLRGLKQMEKEFTFMGNSVRNVRGEMKNLINNVDLAGKRFSLYNEDLAKSIVQQFRFINALTIVSSVMFGLRTAFFELNEESRVLARTFTVMQSSAQSFAEVQATVRREVQQTAIEFGESVETTAEVVKQLGSAGFSAETSLAALRSTMQLVIATQADAEASTRTIAGIYRIFGDQIRGTGNDLTAFRTINDVLISVYRNHQVELDELNQGFKFSAAAAQAAGFTFQETAAFLAVLNDNMIKSGTAGRGLQVIFAQLANKTDQFAEAFNIDIDKDSPLNEQFVSILEQVNRQMGNGALSVAELEKQFKVFGLRGARSFITLAKQFTQVEKALTELNDEADGTADRLSGIVENSLNKQFESAKQALIDIARLGVEPLTDALSIAANTLKGFSEFFRNFEGANVIVVLGLVTGGLVVMIQTILAVLRIFAAMGAELRAVAVASVASAEAIEALGNEQLEAAGKTAINNAELAKQGAILEKTSSQTGKLASASGFLAGKGGLLTVLAGAVALGTIAWTSYNSSLLRTRKNLRELGTQVQDINNSTKKLTEFTNELNDIQNKLDNSAIDTEVAGQKIVQAYNKVGSNLVSDAKIVTKTNSEIVESFRELKAEAESLANTKIDLNNQSLESYRIQLQALTSEEFSKELGIDTNIFGKRDTANIALSIENIDDLDEAANDIQRIENRINDVIATRKSEDKLFDRPLFDRDFDLLENELAEARKRFEFLSQGQGTLRKFNEQIDKAILQFGDVNEAVEFLRGNVRRLALDGDESLAAALDKVLDARLTRFETKGLNLVNPEDVDLLNQAVGPMQQIVLLANAPFDNSVFNQAREQILDAAEAAEQTRQEFVSLNETLDLQTNEGRSREFKKILEDQFDLSDFTSLDGFTRLLGTAADFEAELQKDIASGLNKRVQFTSQSFAETLTASLKSTSPSEQAAVLNALNDLLPKKLKFSKAEILKQLEGGISESEAREISNRLFEGVNLQGLADSSFKLLTADGNQFLKVVSAIAESTGQGAAFMKIFTNNVKDDTVQSKLDQTNQSYEKLVDNIKSAIFALNNFNEIGNLRAQARQIRQVFLVLSDSTGSTIEELQAKYVTVLDKLGKRREALKATGESQADDTQIKNLQLESQQLREQLQRLADINKIYKQITDKITASATALRRTNQQTIFLAKQYQAQGAELAYQTEVIAENLNLEIQLLKETEALNGSYDESLDALNSLSEKYNEILETVAQLRELEFDLAQTRFDTLATLEKIISADNKLADAEFRILSASNTIADAQARINALKRDSLRDSTELVEQQNRQAQALLDIFEIFKDIEEKEKKIAKFADDRLNTLKSIRNIVSEQSDSFADTLKDILKSEFDTNKLETALKIADKLGVSYSEVLAKPDQFIDRVVEGVEAGNIRLDNFGNRVTKIGDELTKVSASTRDFNKNIKDIQTAKYEGLVVLAQDLIRRGNLEEASGLFSQIDQSIKDAFSNDPQGLEQAYKTLLDLQNQYVDNVGEQVLRLKLEFFTDEQFKNVLEAVKDKAVTLKLDVLTQTNLNEFNFDQIVEVIKGFKDIDDIAFFTSEDELGKFNAAFDRLRLAMGQIETLYGEHTKRLQDLNGEIDQSKIQFDGLSKASSKATLALAGMAEFITKNIINEKGQIGRKERAEVKKRFGGFISGYGGGDIVPAMLEPGEYVIPKEAVRKYGTTFFENIRSGRINGFTLGGAIPGAIGGGAPGVFRSPSSSLGSLVDVVRTQSSDISKLLSASFVRIQGLGDVLIELGGKLDEQEAALKIAEEQRNIAKKQTDVYEKVSKQQTQSASKDSEEQSKEFASNLKLLTDVLERRAARAQTGADIRSVAPGLDIGLTLFQDSLEQARGQVATFLSGFFVPEFAKANTEVYEGFIENIRGINAAYADSVNQSQIGLKRNESSYYDYLNAIEDAENQRIKSRLDAERQYRESLIKTEDVFRKKIVEGSDLVFNQFNERISAIQNTINERLFGNLEENINSLVTEITSGLKTAFPGFQDLISGDGKLFTKITDKLGNTFADITAELTENTPKLQKFFGSFEGDGSLLTIIGSAFAGGAGALVGPLVKGIQSALTFALQGDNVKVLTRFIKSFATDLAKGAPTFIDEMVRNVETVVSALIEYVPDIVDSLSKSLPDVVDGLLAQIEKVAPVLAETISKQLPTIIGVLVRVIATLLKVVIDSLPFIVEGLAASIPVLIVEVIKGVFKILPSLFQAIVTIPTRSLFGGLGRGIQGLARGTFHEGGLIPGNSNDIPIIAQSGEGILSRDGMKALGGVGILDQLNRGNGIQDIISNYHEGGIVSRSSNRFERPNRSSNNSTTNNYNNRLMVNANVVTDGKTSRADARKQAKELVDEIELEISRRTKDGNSLISRNFKRD